jgi:hypothetical protein
MIAVGNVPQVVADLTFTPVRGGRVTLPPGCWEEDRAPVVGEQVLVADSGAGPFEATITGRRGRRHPCARRPRLRA